MLVASKYTRHAFGTSLSRIAAIQLPSTQQQQQQQQQGGLGKQPLFSSSLNNKPLRRMNSTVVLPVNTDTDKIKKAIGNNANNTNTNTTNIDDKNNKNKKKAVAAASVEPLVIVDVDGDASVEPLVIVDGDGDGDGDVPINIDVDVPINPIPDFRDARYTYKNKTTFELLRAAACFQSAKSPFLVENAENLLILSRKIFGGRLVDWVLKHSIYGHFCAGEDQRRILPAIQKLAKSGVGSILDYAAENDGSNSGMKVELGTLLQTEDPHTIITVREYDYESEAKCDNHVETFLQCIRDVASMSDNEKRDENGNRCGENFAAVKITALGNPKLLARLSTAIVEAKWLFADFDANGNGLVSRRSFEMGYKRHFLDDEVRIQEIFEEFDPNDTGYIDYITWSMMLSPLDLPKIVKSCSNVGRLADACPTDEEITLLNCMYNRGRKLGKEASKCGVRLLIDAEQVRYQPAIDNLVLELQRQFNTGDIPIIFNTYQCYLKDSPERLRTDVARSERFQYHFGAKIVRGAYMESERELAASLFLDDPIHATIEDTHNCYNESVDYLLEHSTKSELNLEILCGTHNQNSIVQAINSMNKYGIDRSADTVCFAQLFGMSDELTLNLGKNGYRAYKYVPYGEVDEVVPYLLRRAKENSAIMGGATIELGMLSTELKRRFRLSSS